MQGSKKIAVVTGANKGIGFEVARQVAQAGWKVFAAARSPELGTEAAAKLQAEGLDVEFLHIDLGSPETAQNAASKIRETVGKLDVLINNAGIASQLDGLPSKADLQAVKNLMETNFIGTAGVTQAMIPLLQAAGKAQVINVSSELGCISEQLNPSWKYYPVKALGYCASKAALNMLSVQLAYEFRDGSIAINSVNPGYTATDLNGNSGPQTVEQGAAEVVRVALSETPVTGKFLETGAELPW